MPKFTPRRLGTAGQGNGPGARVFRGPEGPVTNSNDNMEKGRKKRLLLCIYLIVVDGVSAATLWL